MQIFKDTDLLHLHIIFNIQGIKEDIGDLVDKYRSLTETTKC